MKILQSLILLIFCSQIYAQLPGAEKFAKTITQKELKEHLYVSSRSECLQLKDRAENSSSAFYKCARVEAKITEGKIVEIIEELEVLQRLMIKIILIKELLKSA